MPDPVVANVLDTWVSGTWPQRRSLVRHLGDAGYLDRSVALRMVTAFIRVYPYQVAKINSLLTILEHVYGTMWPASGCSDVLWGVRHFTERLIDRAIGGQDTAALSAVSALANVGNVGPVTDHGIPVVASRILVAAVRQSDGRAAARTLLRAHGQLLHGTVGAGWIYREDWKTTTVGELVRGIRAERAWDRTPILADALQDAGCDSEEWLKHMRDPEFAWCRWSRPLRELDGEPVYGA